MSNLEKGTDGHSATVSSAPSHDNLHIGGPIPRPAGWQYKGVRIFGTELWYASPKVQLLLVAMVCFLCPGMYNALTGLGGAGQLDTSVNNDASTALYAVFAIVAFFSGTFANKMGVKLTLAIGGMGYCIYSAAFLCYNHTQNRGFVIFAGAFLGLCAGLLWTAQGAVMMSYPPESSKGRYISTFWIIFNMGAVIGAIIPLAQTVNSGKTNASVGDGIYVAFIIIMVIGAIVALFLAPAQSVQREDGTKVILMKNPTWQSEIKGLWECLYLQPWIIALFPMFFASNIFYTYQMNDMNAAYFNLRTRSLNNLLYWAAQIVAAVAMGNIMDIKFLSRSQRAKMNFGILFVLTWAIWGGGYAFQSKQVGRELALGEGKATEEYQANEVLDYTTPGYIGPMFLYIFYGFYDACWQTSIYWYMGALSNSGRKTANMTGFYKGLQSAGACVFFAMDGKRLPFDTMFYSTWGLCAGSLIIAAPILLFKIKDTTDVEEDLKFSDETAEDVLGGRIAERRVAGEI